MLHKSKMSIAQLQRYQIDKAKTRRVRSFGEFGPLVQ